MNCTIWRTKEDRWMLLGACMEDGGYISVSGLWGFRNKNKLASQFPVFEDESSGTYYHLSEKGKNWKIFLALCPELKKFEFWDENRSRMGTFRQEWYLHENSLLYSPFAEQCKALEDAGLKVVNSRDAMDIAIFPADYKKETYSFGSLVLSLPMPKHLQWDFRELCDKENKA